MAVTQFPKPVMIEAYQSAELNGVVRSGHRLLRALQNVHTPVELPTAQRRLLLMDCFMWLLKARLEEIPTAPNGTTETSAEFDFPDTRRDVIEDLADAFADFEHDIRRSVDCRQCAQIPEAANALSSTLSLLEVVLWDAERMTANQKGVQL